MKQHLNIKVYGLVQGVFFRKSAKDMADELAVPGWVRNEHDGSVSIMATGEKETLEKFIEWCKDGPPMSKVEKVEVNWLSEVEDFGYFSII